MIEPLRISQHVACAPDHAFATWTRGFGTWWPRGHTVSGDPDAQVVLEGRPGGRIFERTSDGTEIDWGEVTTWDPPTRLGYLWHIRRDRDDATDVMVTFVAVGDATRIDIVHSGWERLGDDARPWRDANRGGWASLLPHVVAACEARA